MDSNALFPLSFACKNHRSVVCYWCWRVKTLEALAFGGKLHKTSITGCLFAECGGPGRSFEGHAQCVELKLHCWLPFTQFLCSEAAQESMTRWAQHFLIHWSRPTTIIFYLKRGCCYVIFQQLQQNSAQSSFFHMLLFQYILPFLPFWFVIN